MILIQLFCFGCGILLISWSALLYEGEEARIDDILASWWVSLDDMARISIARNVRFVRRISSTVSAWLDGIFGAQLLSVNAVAVSVSLSFSSVMTLRFALDLFSQPLQFAVLEALAGAGLFYVAITSRLPILRQLLLLAVAITFIMVVANRISHLDMPPVAVEATTSFTLALALGALADFTVVLSTRLIAKAAAGANSMWPVSAGLANTALALLIFVVPLLLSRSLIARHRWWSAVLYATAFTNLYASLIGLSFLIVLCGLVLYRIAWPLLTRSIYSLHRFKLFQQRKVLFFAGVTLVAIAVPAAVVVASAIAKVLFPR